MEIQLTDEKHAKSIWIAWMRAQHDQRKNNKIPVNLTCLRWPTHQFYTINRLRCCDFSWAPVKILRYCCHFFVLFSLFFRHPIWRPKCIWLLPFSIMHIALATSDKQTTSQHNWYLPLTKRVLQIVTNRLINRTHSPMRCHRCDYLFDQTMA